MQQEVQFIPTVHPYHQRTSLNSYTEYLSKEPVRLPLLPTLLPVAVSNIRHLSLHLDSLPTTIINIVVTEDLVLINPGCLLVSQR